MSATSGIAPTPELTQLFSDSVSSQSVRFIKVSIADESLVHESTVPVNGSLAQDLEQLQGILQDNRPAYVLVRLDDPPSEWLAIYYVPDTAKVREKMLYASTRASLLKSLGSSVFTDSLFATNKADVLPSAYAAHRAHLAAPKPLSEREREIAAEGNPYEGNRGRETHIGSAGVGLEWTEEAKDAVRNLGEGEGSAVVVITIEAETLTLRSASEVTVDQLANTLPSSEPSYTFFAYPHSNRRYIIFIYACPSSSPIKHRMLYSSGASSVFTAAKSLLLSSGSSTVLAPRKIETSDPKEVDERFILSELQLDSAAETPAAVVGGGGGEEKKAFARPKGPARRPR